MGKKGLRDQLIGAWRLVSYIESPVDGSPKRFPMVEKAQGIIMYTPDGYMSAQLRTLGRKNFASGDWFKGTPEEFATPSKGFALARLIHTPLAIHGSGVPRLESWTDDAARQ